MATCKPPIICDPAWSKKYGNTVVAGKRDVFIIVSTNATLSPEVVPRCSIVLTERDKTTLTNQGIPPECHDDLSILQARISLDKTLAVVATEVSEPGRELSRVYVLKQLEKLMSNTDKDGVVINYFGHGKRNTGDWCFQDGFITFRDIADLYSKHFRGHVLTIVSDCSYSGQWAQACAEFLEEEGVRPCGHSAVEKGILLKVYASCRPWEVAAIPCFSVRGMVSDKNDGTLGYWHVGKELTKTQHPFGGDFTNLVCNKDVEQPCGLLPDSTWQDRIDLVWKHFYTVQETVKGQRVWYYVRFPDTEEHQKKFNERKCLAEVMDHVEVMDFGQGEYCPNDVLERLNKKYAFIY